MYIQTYIYIYINTNRYLCIYIYTNRYITRTHTHTHTLHEHCSNYGQIQVQHSATSAHIDASTVQLEEGTTRTATVTAALRQLQFLGCTSKYPHVH
jgi:carbohydrate-binding DOMON domain-containing protein